MKVLITGGAGCLGSNLLEKLIPDGHQILVIDNFVTGSMEVVPPCDGLQVVEGSVVDESLIEKYFEEFSPDLVIHSAASYNDPTNWREDSLTNVLGSINVANAAEKVGVEKIINFQS